MPQRKNYFDSEGRLHNGKTGKFIKQSGSGKKKPKANAIKPKKKQSKQIVIRQSGGFLLPLAAGLTALRALKPATGLQNIITSNGWDNNPVGNVFSKILDVPKQFGFGIQSGGKFKTATVITKDKSNRKYRL